MEPVTGGEVASKFAVRAGIGVVGGAAGLVLGRLTASGVVGAVNGIFNDLAIDVACELQEQNATGP
jgi:hypothetical protein